MHIKQDHLPLIYQSYSKVVADQGDYLTNRGKINLSVFEALLKGNKGFQIFVEFSVIFREIVTFWDIDRQFLIIRKKADKPKNDDFSQIFFSTKYFAMENVFFFWKLQF